MIVLIIEQFQFINCTTTKIINKDTKGINDSDLDNNFEMDEIKSAV